MIALYPGPVAGAYLELAGGMYTFTSINCAFGYPSTTPTKNSLTWDWQIGMDGATAVSIPPHSPFGLD